VGLRSQIRIQNRFSASLTIAEQGILEDLLALLIVTHDFYETWWNDWRRQDNGFGKDVADIGIWIRINPAILIGIPDHFWLKFLAFAEVCALWAQSYCSIIIITSTSLLSISVSLTLYRHIKTAEQRTIIQQYGDWYTGRWWVDCYIWYSKEGPGRAGAPLRPLLAVPNVTAHPSTASVLTSYHSMWHYS